MTTPYGGPGGPTSDGSPSFQRPGGPGPQPPYGAGAPPYGGPQQPQGGPPGYGAVAQQQPPAGGIPPGWYPGPSGAVQWWDGRGWGPVANDNSSTYALFCYLGMLFVGFLVPLIILLTEGKKNRFVKHHATEALNFAITTGIASLVMVVLYLVGLFASFAGGVGSQNAGVGVGGFVVVIVLFLVVLFTLSIGSLVFTIMGAVKAGQKKYWRYPICIRFVRGAASKEEVEALNSGVAR